MQHLLQKACSSAAAHASGSLGRSLLTADVALPSSSTTWAASRRSASSSASRTPAAALSKNGRRKAMQTEQLFVKSKGKLNLSEAYQDLGQTDLSSTASEAASSRNGPASGSNSRSGAQKPKPKRSYDGKTAKERPRGPPIKERVHAAPALELRDFLKEKSVEDRERRLRKLERDALTTKRNRWAWEWFEAGRELVDIGERMATLSRYASEKPYPSAVVTEWVIEHLRTMPAAASEPVEPVAAATPDVAAPVIPPPAPRTYSLDRLTPELWARLSAPHPVWSTRPFEHSIGAVLENEDHVDRGVWDILWSRGWRGEGLEEEAAAGSVPVRRDGPLPISEEVLERFLRVDERPAAEHDLALGQRLVANAADDLDRMPESARLAMALERLKLAKGQDEAREVVRRIAAQGGRAGSTAAVSGQTKGAN